MARRSPRIKDAEVATKNSAGTNTENPSAPDQKQELEGKMGGPDAPERKVIGKGKFKKQRRPQPCGHPECKDLGIYFFLQDYAMYCAAHQQPGMKKRWDIRLCQIETCSRKAQLGFEGQIKRFCYTHAPEGVVRPPRRVARNQGGKKSKMFCQDEGCDKIASFGFEGEPRRYCAKHKKEGMIHAVLKATPCQHNGCFKTASYGNVGGRPARCSAHRLEGQVDLRHRLCNFPGCSKVAVLTKDDYDTCREHQVADSVWIYPSFAANFAEPIRVERCAVIQCHRTAKLPSSLYQGARYCLMHKDADNDPTILKKRKFAGINKGRGFKKSRTGGSKSCEAVPVVAPPPPPEDTKDPMEAPVRKRAKPPKVMRSMDNDAVVTVDDFEAAKGLFLLNAVTSKKKTIKQRRKQRALRQGGQDGEGETVASGSGDSDGEQSDEKTPVIPL